MDFFFRIVLVNENIFYYYKIVFSFKHIFKILLTSSTVQIEYFTSISFSLLMTIKHIPVGHFHL